jgi:hypothetical protein
MDEINNFISKKVVDHRGRKCGYAICDYIMSAFAIFHLKFPSLLKFDKFMREDISTEEKLDNIVEKTKKDKRRSFEERQGRLERRRQNLKSLYKINNVPSDTQMRTFLDRVSPKLLRGLFKLIFSILQRSNYLKRFQYVPLDNHYLLSVDGTGFFSSREIHCKNCCVKEHKSGKEYYHQALCGAIVHPDFNIVIPLAPEAITKQDGSTKNDCERNASKRFYDKFRKDHPHLPVIAIEDSLSSNTPHIDLLKDLRINFIIGCKPGDHPSLFEFVEGARKIEGSVECLVKEEGNIRHEFEWMNEVPLNDSNPDCFVNFLKYTQIKTITVKKGKKKGETHTETTTWTWVTNILLTPLIVYAIMRAARTRWKIENETFSTLKNQGYNFEHNYGHGYEHLSTVLMYLMMLAFLVDQIQWFTSVFLRRAKKRLGTYKYVWAYMQMYIDIFRFKGWEEFYLVLADGPAITDHGVNSS